MFGNLTGWHAIILLAIVLLLFGATKLPALAKSLGQSTKIFRSEMKSVDVPADGEPVADLLAPDEVHVGTSADRAPHD